MIYSKALAALTLLSAIAVPRFVAAQTDSDVVVTAFVTEDVDPTTSTTALPSATPALLENPNFLNDSQLLKNAPVPINETMNTTAGIFKFSYDTPANLSYGINGTRHYFKGGRDFVYRKEVEIDADIEINIIVQEFCDVCNDRSNRSDFHVYTYTQTVTKTAAATASVSLLATNRAPVPTGTFPVATRQLVAVTTHFPSPTVWTYNYAYRRSTRQMVRTITEAMDVVYWAYQNVVVTKAFDQVVATEQQTQTLVQSTRSSVVRVVTEATTITVDEDFTITCSVVPTTLSYYVVVPQTIYKTVEVEVTSARTQNVAAVSTTPTTAATTAALSPELTSFGVQVYYITQTIYVGGVTKTIPWVTVVNKAEPLIVTSTVTTTKTNGAVVTETVTVTQTASASLLAESRPATITTTTTTVIGGTASVTTSASTSTVPNTVKVIEIKTISIGDRPVTQRCEVNKIARPSVILKGHIRIRITIVIEIFEFFYFELGNRQTSTTTVTSTVTVGIDSTSTATANNTITTGATNSTGTRTTGGLNVITTGTSDAVATQAPVTTISYEIDFTVIAIINGGFYGFCPCDGTQICGRPSSQLDSGNSSVSAPGPNTPFQFVVTETGLLVITTTYQVVYLDSLANPCPVSFGTQGETDIVTIVESIKLVWIVNSDGSLTCYRNGIQVVFFTCTELAGEIKLFAGDSSSFFDLTVCTQVVLNVNNTIGGGHTSGGHNSGNSTTGGHHGGGSGNFNGTTGNHGGHGGHEFPGGAINGTNGGSNGGSGHNSTNGGGHNGGSNGGHNGGHNGGSTGGISYGHNSTNSGSSSTVINNYNTINNYNNINNYFTNIVQNVQNNIQNNVQNNYNVTNNISGNTININSGNTVNAGTTNNYYSNTTNIDNSKTNNISIDNSKTSINNTTINNTVNNVNNTNIDNSDHSTTTINNNNTTNIDNSVNVGNNSGIINVNSPGSTNVNNSPGAVVNSPSNNTTIVNNGNNTAPSGNTGGSTYPTGSFSIGGIIDGEAVVLVAIGGQLKAVSSISVKATIFVAIAGGVLEDIDGNFYGLAELGAAITYKATRFTQRFVKRDLEIIWSNGPEGPIAQFNGQTLVYSSCGGNGTSTVDLDTSAISGCNAFVALSTTPGATPEDIPGSSSASPTTTAPTTTDTTGPTIPPTTTAGNGTDSTPTTTTGGSAPITTSPGNGTDTSATTTTGTSPTGTTVDPSPSPSSAPNGTNSTVSRRHIRRKFALDRIRY